jgi:arylsulfatase A-like enzyme
MVLLTAMLLSCHAPGDDPPRVCLDPSPSRGAITGTGPLQFHGDAPKNLLFLSIDTLRKDHVGLYGDSTLTPTLDCLGEQGVVLDDFQQCANWTWSSMTCTLGGRGNVESGHMPRLVGAEQTELRVPEGTPFLASWLGDAGFYSIVVSANDWLSETWGTTQGYDEVIDPLGGAMRVVDHGETALLDAIRRGQAERWFLHLHFTEPHAPYDPPARYLHELDDLEPWPEDLSVKKMHYGARSEWGDLTVEEQALLQKHLEARYAGEVSLLDDQLADVMDQLDRAGLLEDTLVVVWSDHGEQFWEHGNQTHAYLLHPEETAATAFFWSKNIVSARWPGPTHGSDLVPTALQVLGVPIPDEVTGAVVGEAAEDRLRFGDALARKGGVQSVTQGDLHMQFRWYNGKVEVFDRSVDPGDTTDVLDPTDPTHLQLWASLRARAEAMATLVGGDPTPKWPDDLP